MKKLYDRLNPITQVMLFFTVLIAFAFAVGHVEIEYSHAGGAPVVISDQTGTATTNTAAVTANKLYTVDAGYLNQIREGNVADHTFIRIQGNNLTLGTGLSEMSILGTALYGNWPSSAAVVSIVSDSALDSTGSTGALTLTVRGHTAASVALEETVIMQGTSSVSTLDSFFRIHELEVATAGSGLSNAGLITASIGGTDIIALQDGHSKSTEGRHHVAAGFTMYLQDAEGSAVGTGKNASFHLFTRDTTDPNSPFVLQQIWQAQAGGFTPNGKVAGIPEKHDVIILGQGTAAANVAAASYQGWIEE